MLQGIVEPLTPMGIELFRCLINGMAAFKYGLHVATGESAPFFKVSRWFYHNSTSNYCFYCQRAAK